MEKGKWKKDTLKDRRLSVSKKTMKQMDVKAQETAQVSVAVSKPAENPEELIHEREDLQTVPCWFALSSVVDYECI